MFSSTVRRRNQLEVLEDEPDAAAIFLDLAARERGEVVAVDEDLAFARALLHEQEAEEAWTCRRRSGRSGKRTRLLDRERQIAQRVQAAAVEFREVARLDHAINALPDQFGVRFSAFKRRA